MVDSWARGPRSPLPLAPRSPVTKHFMGCDSGCCREGVRRLLPPESESLGWERRGTEHTCDDTRWLIASGDSPRLPSTSPPPSLLSNTPSAFSQARCDGRDRDSTDSRGIAPSHGVVSWGVGWGWVVPQANTSPTRGRLPRLGELREGVT